MISNVPNEEKESRDYLAIKILVLLRGITSKHHANFYF